MKNMQYNHYSGQIAKIATPYRKPGQGTRCEHEDN